MAETKRVDLLAARRARAEKRAEAGTPDTVLVVGDVEAPLPAELPLAVIEVLGQMMATKDTGKLGDAMAEVVGVETWQEMREAFIADGQPISLDDALDIVGQTMDAYGLEAPESAAS